MTDKTQPSPQAMPREHNVGMWSAGGALTAAVLSSACCWLPLALIGVGVSAAGVGGFFEAYRIHFLVVTALLLGTGFYFVYVRKPKCASCEACAVPNPKLQRFNKIMLWTATVFVLGFAAFPNYVGYVLGGFGRQRRSAKHAGHAQLCDHGNDLRGLLHARQRCRRGGPRRELR